MDSSRFFAHDVALALQFLTRLPLPLRTAPDPARMAAAVKFYPLVGVVVGAILALIHSGMWRISPPLPAAAVTVAAWAMLTGAMHLDGLMDAADGLLSNRGREKALEIMKDSRVGAMGVVAGTITILSRFSAVASISGWPRSAGLLGAAVAGRTAMVFCLILFPYARESGMGSFLRSISLAPAIAGVLGGFAVVLGVAGAAGLFVAACAVVAGLLVAGAANRALGGLTGDVYGAVCEVTEVFALLLWVGFIWAGLA